MSGLCFLAWGVPARKLTGCWGEPGLHIKGPTVSASDSSQSAHRPLLPLPSVFMTPERATVASLPLQETLQNRHCDKTEKIKLGKNKIWCLDPKSEAGLPRLKLCSSGKYSDFSHMILCLKLCIAEKGFFRDTVPIINFLCLTVLLVHTVTVSSRLTVAESKVDLWDLNLSLRKCYP